MDAILRNFREAQTIGSGTELSATLLPSRNLSDLRNFYNDTDERHIEKDIRSALTGPQHAIYRLTKPEQKAWIDVYIAFWRFTGELLACEDAVIGGTPHLADWSKSYNAWKEVTNALIKGYSGGHFQGWTLPCLYVVGKYLRIFAIKADEQAKDSNGDAMFTTGYQDDVMEESNKNEKLEDAARMLNRVFTLCISDRASMEESRKWGLYNITNLLFKTYFRLNSIGLCKSILRAMTASQADMPPLESFPKSHVVTYLYYVGLIHFLEEDYIKAEEYLTQAWTMCHRDAKKNLELILTYLIPCHLINTHTLPSSDLLAPHPQLQALFGPICSCIKKGDLAGFDAALVAGEDAFVRQRIYLTLERGRDVALRNLFRRVFVATAFEDPTESEEGNAKGEVERVRGEKRTRILVAEFAAAVRLGSADAAGRHIEDDEVECLIANLIYKNLIKGYISREHRMVVLHKGGAAFPGTGI